MRTQPSGAFTIVHHFPSNPGGSAVDGSSIRLLSVKFWKNMLPGDARMHNASVRTGTSKANVATGHEFQRSDDGDRRAFTGPLNFHGTSELAS